MTAGSRKLNGADLASAGAATSPASPCHASAPILTSEVNISFRDYWNTLDIPEDHRSSQTSHFFLCRPKRHRHVPSTSRPRTLTINLGLRPQPSNTTLGFVPSDPPLLSTSPHKTPPCTRARGRDSYREAYFVGHSIPGLWVYQSHTRFLPPVTITITITITSENPSNTLDTGANLDESEHDLWLGVLSLLICPALAPPRSIR